MVNLLDEDGEFVFNERQAELIERKLAKTQFAFGQGDYQASEFIKRYFPRGFFDWLIIDEAHEYKNAGAAQGQAMQVLAGCVKQCLLLTGTLMVGYAEDLFYLLWRTMPSVMMQDGYSYHRGKRDTASRLKALLSTEGLKCAVLRASVKTEDREDWILEQVDRGIDVLITNPELVKTGLDLLEFPSIVFTNTGYNVYTLMQAARRSWRIGQRDDVDVTFLGYQGSAQMACLELMAKKIAVTQSTSGDMPDNGLDVLNSDGDSVEVTLAKSLLKQTTLSS